MRWTRKKNSVERELPIVFPRLWRFCVVLAGDQTHGADLAQETAIRALENADKFQSGTNLTAWLIVMARRIWINERRAAAIRSGSGILSIYDSDIPAQTNDAETNIFAREVFVLVSQLPEALRITALLVLVEGFSYAEAAESLDVPIGTIMSRVASSRRKIAEQCSETPRPTNAPARNPAKNKGFSNAAQI